MSSPIRVGVQGAHVVVSLPTWGITIKLTLEDARELAAQAVVMCSVVAEDDVAGELMRVAVRAAEIEST